MDLTRRLWYLVAAVIAMVAWTAGTAYAASAWDPLREAEVTPVGQAIRTDGADLAVLTDLPQPEREIRCFARAPKQERVQIPASSVDVTVDSDGRRWYLLGVLPNATDGVHVACGPADQATDTARYGTALVTLSSRAGTGRAIAWAGLLAGAALALATLVARTRRTFAS